MNIFKLFEEHVPAWDREFREVVNDYQKEKRYDFEELFHTLEKRATTLLSSGKMKENGFCDIPLEMGGCVRFTFTMNNTNIDVIDTKGKVRPMLKSSDPIEKHKGFFNTFENMLKMQELGMGHRYPHDFKDDLMKMSEGDILVSDGKRALMCVKNDAPSTMEFICYNNKSYSFNDFDLTDTIKIEVSKDSDIQLLYNELKNKDNKNLERIGYNVEPNHDIKNKIQKYYSQIKRGDVLKLRIGPDTFRIKKALISDKPIWYYNGAKISEQEAKMYFAYIDKAPTEFVYSRENDTLEKEHVDNFIKKEVDNSFALHNYRDAAFIMMKYCEENNKELQINMNTYHDNEAVSFIFQCDDDNRCHILQAYYEDNNFSKDITIEEEVTIDEFRSFCEEKYQETYMVMHAENYQSLIDKYPMCKSDMLAKMTDSLSEKDIKKKEQFGELFQQEVKEVEKERVPMHKSFVNRGEEIEI